MIKSLFSTTAKSVGSIGLKVVIVSAATLGGAALVSSSVFASLTATAFNTSPQSVSTGTLKLSQAPSGVAGLTGGFLTAIAAMAPGDTVNRFVDVTNAGTLAGQTMTFKVAEATSSVLTSDATNGLQVIVKECTVVYTTGTGLCSGAETTAIASTSANTLLGAQTINFASLNPSGITHLRIIITLPALLSEVSVNGGTPIGITVQGITAALTWTLTETQRTATITNS